MTEWQHGHVLHIAHEFDKQDEFTCLVLELVSSQDAIGLQRFRPFQVDRVQTSAINLEEPWSVWNYNHNKREKTVCNIVATCSLDTCLDYTKKNCSVCCVS